MDDSSDQFPIGMRVLAVDDDPPSLMLLETLLRSCQYHDMFDLVIAEVHMPDMDGLKMLELVGLEMDLPVIMLSAYGDTELVMKAISHGARDFLLKPVRLEELRNIWQHVIRNTESQFVWSMELHRKFLEAVNQLGVDKAVPKKIFELMNVENLTREDMATHLQKYRLFLKRMDGSGHFNNNTFRSFSPSGIVGNLNGQFGHNSR